VIPSGQRETDNIDQIITISKPPTHIKKYSIDSYSELGEPDDNVISDNIKQLLL
jgi:hypothetical protein